MYNYEFTLLRYHFANTLKIKNRHPNCVIMGVDKHFCKDKMSEMSYSSDSKYAVFPRSRRMFYIPRTCPRFLQKIFQWLSKSKTSQNAQNILSPVWLVKTGFSKKLHGVHAFVNIKCLVCRTAFIQSALCSPDLGECFTYPEPTLVPRTCPQLL